MKREVKINMNFYEKELRAMFERDHTIKDDILAGFAYIRPGIGLVCGSAQVLVETICRDTFTISRCCYYQSAKGPT